MGGEHAIFLFIITLFLSRCVFGVGFSLVC